jgi:serine/threonine protein kinase
MTTTTAHTGTERYLAPELVNGDDLEYPTAASDIYAMGCLGLEVRFHWHTYRYQHLIIPRLQFVFGEKVYAHRKHNLRGCLIDDIASGMPPAEKPEDVDAITSKPWEVIQSCWNAESAARPSASRLLEQLNEPVVDATNA